MPQGTVRWFDPDRGFGFLAPEDGSADLFVHASEIVSDGGTRLLRESQVVDFEVGEGPRGPQALRVQVTGDVAAGAVVGVLGSITWYEPGKGYGFVLVGHCSSASSQLHRAGDVIRRWSCKGEGTSRASPY